MKHIRSRVARIAVVLGLILCVAYIAGRTPSHAQSAGVTIFAVTIGNSLVSFDSTTPGILKTVALISGLQPGETIQGMDFHPRHGRLYALGSTNRLYTIDTASGAALLYGTGPVGPPLAGSAIGFDFNPVEDYIRVVTDADENLRLKPSYPVTIAAVEENLRYAAGDAWDEVNPNVVAAAYTDKFLGTTVTTLLGIDIDGERLIRQGSPDGAPISPNSGLLSTIGKLGVSTTGMVGFDIASVNEVGYASLTAREATLSQLFTINLQSGAATLVGNIGSTEAIRDIAVFVPPGLWTVSAASQYSNFASESMVISLFSDSSDDSLAGITVRVFDSAHTERFAPLVWRRAVFICYQIPPGTATGPAVTTITDSDGKIKSGLIQVDRVAPGIFMANFFSAYQAGSVADALALRVSADGTQRYEEVTQQARYRECSPIDLGPESDRVFLVLFATGLRFFSSLSAITATIGGVNVPVVFAGAHPTLVGVDQVNVLLPRSLIGRGKMDVQLIVDGQPSNKVFINVK